MDEMTDAERLMRGFIPQISETPFRIALERHDQLRDEVFGGTPWDLHFVPGPSNFLADPKSKDVYVRFAALLSLWAAARAALLIGQEAVIAQREGRTVLEVLPGNAMGEALELLGEARALLADPAHAWSGRCLPDANAVPQSEGWYTNNLFLGATGWVLLHEIAHIHLQHEDTTTDYLLRRQEDEADCWASNWTLRDVQNARLRDFRIFAIATALCWIGLNDEKNRAQITHPHAAERFAKCYGAFDADELAPGLELSTYVVKAFFEPSTALPVVDTPNDALIDVLTAYSRKPR